MGKHSTKIEWTHIPGFKGETWNPIRAINKATGKRGWHCEHVTEACRFCYAERLNENLKFGNGLAFKPGHRSDIEIFLDEKTLIKPLHWRASRAIFVESMSDLYGPWVEEQWLDKIYAVAALCPQHIFIILTKRPVPQRSYLCSSASLGRIWGSVANPSPLQRYGHPDLSEWPLPNVWHGTSVSGQEDADKFVPHLLDTPSAVRFVSCEPMLTPLDFNALSDDEYNLNALTGLRENPFGDIVERFIGTKIDWVICGGESGPPARPMHPHLARALRDQCEAAGVPFFFKQWGEWYPVGADELGPYGEWIGGGKEPRIQSVWGTDKCGFYCSEEHGHVDHQEQWMKRIGKKAAGRRLDGRIHHEFPIIGRVA